MKRMLCLGALFLSVSALAGAVPGQAPAREWAPRAGQQLANYFREETAAIASRCVADIRSLEDWQARRGEYRRQLQEMLGLWPMPDPSKWPHDLKKSNHTRRRYMLLGQTLDGMRVWDIRCAAQAIKALPEFKKTPLHVRANHHMAVNAAYAALFEPEIVKLKLEGVPASQAEGPDYLNVLKVWDLPQLWDVLGERAEVKSP